MPRNESSTISGLVAPAVTLAHLAWRPPALRLAQDLLKTGTSTFAGLERAERLLAWHEQRVRRYVPALAPSRPARVRAIDLQPAARLAHESRPEVVDPVEARTIESPSHPARQVPSQEPEQVAERTQAVLQREDLAHEIEHSVPQVPISRSGPVRLKAVRLTEVYKQTSRATEAGADAGIEAEAAMTVRPWSPVRLRGVNERESHVGETAWKGQSKAESSPEPKSRQELPQAATPYPASFGPPLLPAQTEPSVPLATPAILPPLAPPKAQEPLPTSATQTVIEKLIERMRAPEPLPGLAVRLVKPADREANETPKTVEREAARSGITPPPQPVPAIDINGIADKVYETLMRRERFERERRGMY